MRFERGTGVTIGTFDGVHIGHQKLIEKIVGVQGLEPTVFTFNENPGFVLHKQKKYYITDPKTRETIFLRLGIKNLIIQDFDEKFRSLSHGEWFEKYLIGILNAKLVVVGTDFRYGLNGEGTVESLRKQCGEYGIQCMIIPPVKVGSMIVSSTKIRRLISEGNIEQANVMLGYPFTIRGNVVHGNGIGRIMGIPTANVIPVSNQVSPPYGVYASEVEIKGVRYKGVTNYGGRPTVGDITSILETYILDFDEDLYGQEIVVHLKHKIRDIRKYRDLEELKKAIDKDIQTVYSDFPKEVQV